VISQSYIKYEYLIKFVQTHKWYKNKKLVYRLHYAHVIYYDTCYIMLVLIVPIILL